MLPPEAEKIRLEILRKMSGEERMKIAFKLNYLTRKMMEAGIRNQYPNISAEEFNKQIALRIEK